MANNSHEPYVVADKLTDLEEDRLNHFLKTWQKEFGKRQMERKEN